LASYWWLLKEISAYLFRAFDVIGVESALHLESSGLTGRNRQAKRDGSDESDSREV